MLLIFEIAAGIVLAFLVLAFLPAVLTGVGALSVWACLLFALLILAAIAFTWPWAFVALLFVGAAVVVFVVEPRLARREHASPLEAQAAPVEAAAAAFHERTVSGDLRSLRRK